jgi:cell fate regulator YaaT (PSP1 superfamily)
MSTEVEDSYVGVRFGEETNLTLCTTGGAPFARGDRVMVELDEGPAHARVEKVPMPVFKPCQKSSARKLLRLADVSDVERYERKVRNELSAKNFAREKVRELGLKMKISKIEFALNGKSAQFWFTAEKRVDFRELVRLLGRRFSARVLMIQIGSRDEAALLGGVGVCGRTLCCSSWMTEFRPISIQMAKRQRLSLNPSKISGQCGRLLCCLAYEDDNYKKPPAERLTKLGNGAAAS